MPGACLAEMSCIVYQTPLAVLDFRMLDPIIDQVRSAVRVSLHQHARIVLAVSGGLDSMVMLDAAASTSRERIAAVATFDHATGVAARRAVRLVRRTGATLGIPVRSARATATLRTEEAWREARWSFLRSVARELEAPVVTAHTDDDQLETVVMRILRGAGARGLAGLAAPGGPLRPLLGFSRAGLERYARARGLRWVVDPSNESRAFLRNRVRHELLPALRAADPDVDRDIRSIALRAAEWRAEVERALASIPMRTTRARSLRVAASALHGYDRESLRVVWPALAARVGARLDRRGTSRLAEFTITCPRGAAQLSGGWEVVRARDELVLRRAAGDPGSPRWLCGRVELGSFRFRPAASMVSGARSDDPWWAVLPAGERMIVRAWRAGDRMRAAGAKAPRRVKRFLSDAGIAGPERTGWPVIEAAGEVVWIPGVRRSDAATVRSGRPGVVYHCERLDR